MRKLRIVLVASIISLSSCFGMILFANSRIDSIQIEKMLTVAYELIADNLDSALITSQEALALSLRLEHPYLIAFSQYRSAHINRLLGNKIKSDSLIDLSLNGFKVLNLPSFVGMVEIEIGNAFMNATQLDSAEYYFLKALPKKIKAKDTEGEGIIYNNLGTIEDYRGNYSKALLFYQKALPIYQLWENAEMESNCYNNISIIQYNIGEIEAAILSAKKATKINREIGHFYNLCMNHICLANYFLELEENGQAEYHANRSIELADSLNFELGKLYALAVKGDIVFKREDKSLSFQYYRTFLELFPDDGDPYMLAQVKHKIGLVYSETNQSNLALEMLEEAKNEFEELGTVHEMMSVHEALAKVNNEKALYQNAFMHLQISNIYRDSFFNAEKAKEIIALEKIYENEKKERQLVEKDLVLAKKQKQNIILLMLLLLAEIGVILYWRKYLSESKRAKMSKAIADKFELENIKVIEENQTIGKALQKMKRKEDSANFIQNILEKPISLFDNLIYPPSEILYFESRDDAIYYFTTDKKYHIPTYGSLKRLAETTFVPPIFIQVHRKHLVNIFNVKYFDPKSLQLHLKDNTVLKVARSKKQVVIETIEKYFSN